MPDLPSIHCPCGNTYTLRTCTVCPECHRWPSLARQTLAIVLEAKRDELRARLGQREPIAVTREPDPMDDGLQLAEREVATVNLSRERELLRQVEAALERIRDGSFGTCLRCEEVIAPKRLAAVPWAALCRECQEQLEQKAAVGTPPREEDWEGRLA